MDYIVHGVAKSRTQLSDSHATILIGEGEGERKAFVRKQVNFKKEKLIKHPNYNGIKKNEILRNKFNQGGKRSEC